MNNQDQEIGRRYRFAKIIKLYFSFFLLSLFILGINKAEAAITFGANGTFQGGIGSLTVGVPSSYTQGDLLLLLVESANQTIATPSGWTQVTNSPQYTGTAATAGGVRVAAFYKIATASESSVTVADTGNHTTAVMLNFVGVNTTTPIEVTAGSVSAATTAMSFPTVTTTSTNDMIVLVAGMDTDASSSATVASWTNANLTSLTERIDKTINSGVGGGLGIATGLKATAGATGTTTATGSTSVTHAYLTIALKPISDSTPTVTTPTSTSIGITSATLGANVTSLGMPASISERGTCWGTSPSPTTNCLAEGGTTTGVFTQSRTGLSPSTFYYYRGYAINATGTSYTSDNSFTTQTIPTVTSPTKSSIGSTTATLGSTLTSPSFTVDARGTCWDTTSSPITNCLSDGTTNGVYTQARTGLTQGVLIYYRGYATYTDGAGISDTIYSTDDSFTTLTTPTLTTPTSTSISTTGATLGANVTSDGGSTITARGTCWGTSASPTTNCSTVAGTTGTFTGPSSGTMTSNTLIYYRGYATNSAGTDYSSDGTFSTLGLPVVVTPTVTSISATGATLGANVTSLGNPASISERGTCWGTSPSPTTNCLAEGGTTTGVFTQSRTGLTSSTLYYYRGYATNTNGTSYSSDGTFSTLGFPIVTTSTSTNVTATSVTVNGDVVSDGGSIITERGFVWGTSMDPNTSGSKVIITGTTGVYTGNITGLTSNTLYYVRAYATNTTGTSYGTNDSFITPQEQLSPETILDTPDLMTTSDTTPTLEMTASDINGDDVEYNIQISTDSSFAGSEQWVAVGDVSGTSSLAHSSNGIDWTGDGKTLFTTYGDKVAYNGSMWVATGQGTNTLAYSYNGIDWTGLGTTIFSTVGYGVSWNGSMWVAGGQGTNTLAYSYNGIDWIGLGTTIFSTIGYGVAWNGSMWIAVGQGTNSIAYSSNGTSWTGVSGSTSIFSSYGRAVAWNGSMWVAGGVGTNTLAHSSNGIDWTGDGTSVFSSSVTGLAWNGSIFVATGNDTTKNFATSSNGTSWTGVTGKTIFSNWGKDIAWNGTKFVAAGQGTANSFAYSSNGTDWTGVGISPLVIPNGIASNSPVSMVPSISTVTSFDKKSETDTGFLNTITSGDTHPFNQGEKVSYTVPTGSELALGTYYWRARAIDPSGTNIYGSWATARTFTVSAALPPYEQSSYRVFSNLNNTDVGYVVASQDTPADLEGSGNDFRLRVLVHMGTDIALNGQDFKLQFAEKSGGCDTSFVGETYADITQDTIIGYNNNFFPNDGSALTPNINDPIHSTDTTINQSYVESNNFTNSIGAVLSGQDAEWDFSLSNKGITSNTPYCFRIVKSDGSLLDIYSVIPEIITEKYVSRGGGVIENIESEAIPDAIVTGGNQSGGTEDVISNVVLPQCSDSVDNNNDTLVDVLDPNCHMDGNINNQYISQWDSETVAPISVTGGGNGGGGGGDLGLLQKVIKSIFDWSSYKTLGGSLLGSVFNIFS